VAIDTATPNPDLVQARGQFSTFLVADMFFGVDVLQVQEVLRAQQMSPVPQAPDVIKGLINLRGQIVTAIDMRRQLGLPQKTDGEPPMNMVVRTSDGAVSLLVDEIGDVLETDPGTYERTPENLDPGARDLIRGVYKLKDRLLLVLDTEKAVEVVCSESPRSRFDSPSSEAIPDPQQEASAISEADTVASSKPKPPKNSAKPATRKTPVKRTSGTARAGIL